MTRQSVVIASGSDELYPLVITGLVPVIHVFSCVLGDKVVDGRVKPGHDGRETACSSQ
jgi:hypothetical protein